jgi:hypothetical protein
LFCDDGKGYTEKDSDDCLSCTHFTDEYSISDAVADATVLAAIDKSFEREEVDEIISAILDRLHRFYCGDE